MLVVISAMVSAGGMARDLLRCGEQGDDMAIVPRRGKPIVVLRTFRLLLLSLLLFGVDLHRQRSLPQSSSASRCTAGAAGLLNLSQCRVRPLTYGEPRRFDTIPSQPSLQAWR